MFKEHWKILACVQDPTNLFTFWSEAPEGESSHALEVLLF